MRRVPKSQRKGMGTTIVLALLTDDFVVVGHVGDSRCYLWQEENELTQITSDHSLVNELVRTGQISELDAEEHPRICRRPLKLGWSYIVCLFVRPRQSTIKANLCTPHRQCHCRPCVFFKSPEILACNVQCT